VGLCRLGYDLRTGGNCLHTQTRGGIKSTVAVVRVQWPLASRGSRTFVRNLCRRLCFSFFRRALAKATCRGSRPVPDNPDGPRLSWYKPNSVSAFARWRSFVSLGFLSARRRDAGCDYYPRVPSRLPRKRAGNPSPLLCLAPHGVFRAILLTLRSGGLLPRLFTLTHHHQLPVVGVSCQLNQLKFGAKRMPSDFRSI
jgi:hypothetical protein